MHPLPNAVYCLATVGAAASYRHAHIAYHSYPRGIITWTMIPLLAYSRERDVEKNSTKDCVDVCVCVWVGVEGGWNCNTDNYIRHANIKQANQLPIGLFRLFIN